MADCCIPGSNGGLPLPPMELRHQVYRMLGEHDSEGTLPSRENGRTTISPSADWKGQTDTGGDEHSHKLRMLFRTAAQENFRLTSRVSRNLCTWPVRCTHHPSIALISSGLCGRIGQGRAADLGCLLSRHGGKQHCTDRRGRLRVVHTSGKWKLTGAVQR